MQRYEFKVIPAPRKGEKARTAKTPEERFALALTQMMNELGRDGWDYVRADTLPVDERSGLTGTKTTFQTVLVFRRVVEDDMSGATARPFAVEEALAKPRLGPAKTPLVGAAPALGPASDPLGGLD